MNLCIFFNYWHMILYKLTYLSGTCCICCCLVPLCSSCVEFVLYAESIVLSICLLIIITCTQKARVANKRKWIFRIKLPTVGSMEYNMSLHLSTVNCLWRLRHQQIEEKLYRITSHGIFFVAEKFWLPCATSCRKLDMYFSRNDCTFDMGGGTGEAWRWQLWAFFGRGQLFQRRWDLWLYGWSW